MSSGDPAVRLARLARLYADRVAVSDERGTTWTYAELERLHYRLISGLREWALGPDDVVGIISANRSELPLIHEAAFRGGFYFTPVNPRLKPEEVRYLLEDSAARVLFVDDQHLALASDASAGLDCTVIELDGIGTNSLAAVLAAGRDDPLPFTHGGNLSYTSGTTGRPKAVFRPRSASHRQAREQLAQRLNYDPDHNRHLAVLPMHHGAGWIAPFRAMSVGSTVFIRDSFEAEQVLEVIERERITSTTMVATMFHRLLGLPDRVRAAYDVSSIRSIEHLAAPTAPVLKARMIDWFGPVLFETYAASEGAGHFTFCTSAEWLARQGTVGKPDDWEIIIRDHNGEVVPPGQVGRVFYAAPTSISPFEYRGDPAKTAAAYHPSGQFTVGDCGYLDEDGWLYLTGRVGDVIISGGVNVYPAEVEAVLVQHPLVRDVGVVGVPDHEWGEIVTAVVQLDRDAQHDPGIRAELITFCRTRIAHYKCPREVRVVDDLGRSPNGKLRRERLRNLVGQR